MPVANCRSAGRAPAPAPPGGGEDRTNVARLTLTPSPDVESAPGGHRELPLQARSDLQGEGHLLVLREDRGHPDRSLRQNRAGTAALPDEGRHHRTESGAGHLKVAPLVEVGHERL